LIRDAETETLLQSIVKPLFRAAGLDTGMLRIMLVRDRAINAFVGSGNRMFVHTGLLARANSAREIAGTLAHETAHVAHGDMSRLPELSRDALISSLGGLLIAAAAGVASGNPGVGVGAALGGMSMTQRHLLSFSRGQEEKADESGLRYLDKLGWPSSGLLDLFAKLEQEEALVINRSDPYLITHPMTQDRLGFVRRHVEATASRGFALPATLETNVRMIQAKLAGFLDPPAAVTRAYPTSDNSAPARYARAALEHRLAHREHAVWLLDGLRREQPGNPWLLELKGQILFESGQVRAAIAPYTESVRLAPEQPLLRQALGHAMIETNDRALLQQAISHLRVAHTQDREDDATWHLLGIAWGRLGEMGEANLALAEEAMLANDIPLARRFARQAAEALPPGPSKLRALDISNAVKKENRQ